MSISPRPEASVSRASPSLNSTKSASPAAATLALARSILPGSRSVRPDQAAAAHVAQRGRHVDRRNSHRGAELDDALRLAGAGAHVEEASEPRRDAQEIVRIGLVDRVEIAALGRDGLADHLFAAAGLVDEGLHQRRVGDLRLLVQAIEDVRDEARAE